MADDDRLLSTPEAARRLGIARSTLAKYARNGIVRPTLVLPGGQYRWRLSHLVEQIEALRQDDGQEDE